MKKIDIIKNGSKLVFSFGIGVILDGVVKNVLPPMGIVKNACVTATTFMAGWYIEDKLADFTALKVDKVLSYAKEKMKEEEA